jgi:hypothetical protein
MYLVLRRKKSNPYEVDAVIALNADLIVPPYVRLEY